YESVNPGTSDYLIRSTVLKNVLTKLDANGLKDTTYVPTHGLATVLQQKDYQSNPTIMGLNRDPLGIQEEGKAYDPFGNLIANVQPPVVGPPPYFSFSGPGYSTAGWYEFINANNFSGGCYSAENNNPAICNDVVQRLLDDPFHMVEFKPDFLSNLPGARQEMWAAENHYVGEVQQQFHHLSRLD